MFFTSQDFFMDFKKKLEINDLGFDYIVLEIRV